MSTDSSENLIKYKNLWVGIIGIVVAIIAFFGSQIAALSLVSFYPIIKGWSSTQANDWFNNSTFAQFLFVLIAESLAVAIIVLSLKLLKKYLEAPINIGLRKPKFSDLLYGLLGFPLYLVIYIILTTITEHFYKGLNVNQKQQLGFNNVHGNGELILTFVSLVILPPIAEEIIFRGLIYASLKKITKLAPAVLITSLLFAAGHLLEGGSSGPLYIAGIDTFCLSLVLILLREKTGGLWSSMTLHGIKNMIAFVALFALHLT